MIKMITEPRFCQILDSFILDIERIRNNDKNVGLNIKTARRRLDKRHRIILSVNPLTMSINISFLYLKNNIATANCFAGGDRVVYSEPKEGSVAYWSNQIMSRSDFYSMIEKKHPPFFEWLLWNQI